MKSPKSAALEVTVTRLSERVKALDLRVQAIFVDKEKAVGAYNVFCEATRQSYIALLALLNAGQNREAAVVLTNLLANWEHDGDEPACN